MFQNVHFPVTAMGEGTVKNGGLCSVKYFKKEDVLTWPSVDPQTGTISSTITLKPGKFIYLCESINESRGFSEAQKENNAGPFFETTIKATLPGSAAAQILALGTMIHHQFGLIVEDKSGITRLIGNQDSGASLVFNYTSGESGTSRKTELTFKWEHPQPAPIYEAEAFNIVIGGETISAGTLQLILRFVVGDPGAPMNDGDIVLTNSGFVNKYCLVLADGTALPVDDGSGSINWIGSIKRHIEKTFGGNSITFVGAVVDNETIEIYAFT